MLKKRIIPCLDIQEGRTVKGVNFVGLVDAGNPIELAKRYVAEGADELVFLDIKASVENRNTRVELVSKIAREINIPFTVGGGINSLEDAKAVIQAGADKVSINTSAVNHPALITDIATHYGNQCVVVAIDTLYEDGVWSVYTQGGRTKAHWETLAWAKEAERLGAGELLLTSMNHDGVKSGFALEILQLVSEGVNIPVIASGGAGAMEHFDALFTQTAVSAALAASIFHFGEIPLPQLKQFLKSKNIQIR